MKNIFPIHKPKGPTSHDIVDRVRRVTGVKKVGHAGTLDPLAEGVLVVAIGRAATRQLAQVVAKEKEYVAEIRLGQTSATDDEEGEKKMVSERVVAREEIEKVLPKFQGKIKQVPPDFSAIKLKGKKAYELARSGKKPQLDPREVEIKDLEILTYDYPVLKIRFVTGAGVYIRALARDIGRELKVGGYLQSLVRTRVGEFTLDKAVNIEDLKDLVAP